MGHTSKTALSAIAVMALAACGGPEPQIEETFASEPGVVEPTRSEPNEPPTVPDDDRAEESTSTVPEAAPAPTAVVLVDAGQTIRVVLDESVSTDSHTAGQTFAAHVADNVTGPNGVAIPQGTQVNGVVRAATESASSDEPATLVLAIESVLVDGETIPLEGSVSDTELEGDRRDSTGQTVGKIAIGTAAGAILGGILGDGDRSDAVRGAIAGAAGGAIVAFTTQDGHATADEGSVLVITLERAIVS